MIVSVELLIGGNLARFFLHVKSDFMGLVSPNGCAPEP